MSDASTLDRDQAGTKAKGKYRIIDADQHGNPPLIFWKDYLPEKFKDQAPWLEKRDDAVYAWFEGRERKLNPLSTRNALASLEAKARMELDPSINLATTDAATRLGHMDTDGIDVAVMYGGGPLGTTNTELYFESFRAYNRYMKDYCDHDRNRLLPVGYLPMRDVNESIQILHEVARMGFTTVNIPAFPQDPDLKGLDQIFGNPMTLALTGNPHGERQYNQPEFDPFWAAAQDLDIALSLHLGTRPVRFDKKEHFLPDLLMSKMTMAEPVAILIFGGVFDRFPRLRFGTIESGGGWMAFASDYMDRTWEKQKVWTESAIKHYPSHYMDQNVYASFIHDRIAIECCHMPGARNVMWSSDFPHSETTYPESGKWIERLFKDIPESDRRAILCDNATRFFRVDG